MYVYVICVCSSRVGTSHILHSLCAFFYEAGSLTKPEVCWFLVNQALPLVLETRLCFPSAGMTGGCHSHLAFMWLLGTQPLVPILACHVLVNRSQQRDIKHYNWSCSWLALKLTALSAGIPLPPSLSPLGRFAQMSGQFQ